MYVVLREEISACAVVHTRYVVDACDPQFFCDGMSFVPVALKRLNVSEPEH